VVNCWGVQTAEEVQPKDLVEGVVVEGDSDFGSGQVCRKSHCSELHCSSWGFQSLRPQERSRWRELEPREQPLSAPEFDSWPIEGVEAHVERTEFGSRDVWPSCGVLWRLVSACPDSCPCSRGSHAELKSRGSQQCSERSPRPGKQKDLITNQSLFPASLCT